MSPNDPTTWRPRPEWHPDCDAEWELPQLVEVATRLLRSGVGAEVYLHSDEPECLRVDVMMRDAKVGEIYVNREFKDDEAAVFSVYAGAAQYDIHTKSIEEAVAFLLESKGAWPS